MEPVSSYLITSLKPYAEKWILGKVFDRIKNIPKNLKTFHFSNPYDVKNAWLRKAIIEGNYVEFDAQFSSFSHIYNQPIFIPYYLKSSPKNFTESTVNKTHPYSFNADITRSIMATGRLPEIESKLYVGFVYPEIFHRFLTHPLSPEEKVDLRPTMNIPVLSANSLELYSEKLVRARLRVGRIPFEVASELLKVNRVEYDSWASKGNDLFLAVTDEYCFIEERHFSHFSDENNEKHLELNKVLGSHFLSCRISNGRENTLTDNAEIIRDIFYDYLEKENNWKGFDPDEDALEKGIKTVRMEMSRPGEIIICSPENYLTINSDNILCLYSPVDLKNELVVKSDQFDKIAFSLLRNVTSEFNSKFDCNLSLDFYYDYKRAKNEGFDVLNIPDAEELLTSPAFRSTRAWLKKFASVK